MTDKEVADKEYFYLIMTKLLGDLINHSLTVGAKDSHIFLCHVSNKN